MGVALRRFRLPWVRVSTTAPQARWHHGVRLTFSVPTAVHVDVAPLQGFHAESVDDVVHMATELAQASDSIERWLQSGGVETLPSLSAALWLAQENPRPADVKTAVLAGASDMPSDVVGEVVKLKVGRRDLDAELEQVRSFAAVGRVRLDGNRGCTASAAAQLTEAAGANLDFFEEPGEGWRSLWAQHTPLAVDETLAEVWKHRSEPPSEAFDAAVWVLKPSVLGGGPTRQLLELATTLGKRAVLSSSFEVMHTAERLRHLAAAFAPDEVHGLGTGGFLGDAVFDDEVVHVG